LLWLNSGVDGVEMSYGWFDAFYLFFKWISYVKK